MTKDQALAAFAQFYFEDTGYTADDVENCLIIRGASAATNIPEPEFEQAVREYAAKSQG